MARGVNKVIIVGNLGQDPEVRYMPNGNAVANMTVATSESWKDQQGQLQEKTEWHRIVLYKRLAEIADEYLRKGAKVYLEGKLQTRKWTDQQGVDRYTTEIVCHEMQMLDSKPGNGAGAPASNAAPAGGNRGNSGGWGQPQGGPAAPQGGANRSPQQPAQGAAPSYSAPLPDFDDDYQR